MVNVDLLHRCCRDYYNLLLRGCGWYILPSFKTQLTNVTLPRHLDIVLPVCVFDYYVVPRCLKHHHLLVMMDLLHFLVMMDLLHLLVVMDHFQVFANSTSESGCV